MFRKKWATLLFFLTSLTSQQNTHHRWQTPTKSSFEEWYVHITWRFSETSCLGCMVYYIDLWVGIMIDYDRSVLTKQYSMMEWNRGFQWDVQWARRSGQSPSQTNMSTLTCSDCCDTMLFEFPQSLELGETKIPEIRLRSFFGCWG